MLNNETIEFLKKEFSTIKNVCYKCGSDKHYIKNCDMINISDYIEKFRNYI